MNFTKSTRYKPMSLVVALDCPEGIVVAADRRMLASPDGMNYPAQDATKLKEVPGGVVGMVGRVHELTDLLDRSLVKTTPSPRSRLDTCLALTKNLKAVCTEKYTRAWTRRRELERNFGKDESVLLFVTYAGGESAAYQLAPEGYWGCHATGFPVAIGQWRHGGLYYMTRFGGCAKTLRQSAYLAYFCLREVGSLDSTLSKPDETIDIKLVTAKGVKSPPESWDTGFAATYAETVPQMRRWFGC